MIHGRKNSAKLFKPVGKSPSKKRKGQSAKPDVGMEWWFRADEEEILGAFAKIKGAKKNEYWTFLQGSSKDAVCLVAHADTVHWNDPEQVFYDPQHQVYWSPTGLGADDRAGCYAVWSLWEKLKGKHSVLITTGEESGGIGATDASEILEKELAQHSFFIQFDRRGSKDAVFYDVGSHKFEKYVLGRLPRFREAHGSFTDICILCPTAQKCGVNLSIGYKNEHTEKEYLNVKHMHRTMQDVARWLKSPSLPTFNLDPQPKYTPVTQPYMGLNTGTNMYNHDDGMDYYGGTSYTAPEKEKDHRECEMCQVELGEDERYFCVMCQREYPELTQANPDGFDSIDDMEDEQRKL